MNKTVMQETLENSLKKKKPSEEAINKYRLALFAKYYSRKITRKYTF